MAPRSQEARDLWQQKQLNRLKDTADEFSKLEDCVAMAKALFKPIVFSELDTLNRQRHAYENYIVTMFSDSTSPEEGARLMIAVQDRDLLGEGQITKDIKQSIEVIERELLPILRGDAKNSPTKP